MATDTATKVLAGVGILALIGAAASSAVAAILDNINVATGNAQLDYNTPPLNPITGEIYVRVDLPVIITNSNPFPLGVGGFSGIIKYGEIVLTTVSLPYGGLWIGAGETKTILVNVDIPIKRVIEDFNNALTSGNLLNVFLNKVLLSGTISLTGDSTSVTFPIENIAIPVV